MDSAPTGTAPVLAPDDAGPDSHADRDGHAEPPAATDGTDAGGARAARPRWWWALAVALVVLGVASLVLRFWTTSDLWLDEALTVDVARHPLSQLPGLLRRDGAPPLFYVLLHFWMGIFGQSDVAVRALSGVFGVATIPLVWLAGRRLGGKIVGWAALVLVVTSPFAVRYDTETRMYALVAFLTVAGFLALDRALRRPRAANLTAVAVVTAALLYSHYWSIYLVGVVGVWLVFESRRGRPAWRRTAPKALAAVAVGCVAFLPWVPIFLFQSRHTGTPWATPADFAAMVNAVSSFAGGGTNQGRALGLLYFALAGLGVFGLAVSARHIDLDLRTRPRGRPLAIVILGTLAAAIIGGFVSRSAFDARYASVVFVPMILLVALGVATFADRRVRSGVLVVAVAAGLAGSIPNITTNRTQAGQVAAAIQHTARPGDVIAYCPDQLGPAVARLLPAEAYVQTTFPRGTGPELINWVDYGAAVAAASPLAFAQGLEQTAGDDHSIYLVWASGYQTMGVKCEGILQSLAGDPAYVAHPLVAAAPTTYYQPMSLVRFTPATG